MLLDELPSRASVLVIHAHPDDEVFATGATIATLTRLGHTVQLYLATGGEAAELPSSSWDRQTPKQAKLELARKKRVTKLNASCHALGIARWFWLAQEGRWIDSGRQRHDLALSPACMPELIDNIHRIFDSVQPQVVLTVGDDGLTGHPDHVLIHQAVIQARSSYIGYAPKIFGAHVRSHDIQQAQQTLRTLNNDAPVGSGTMAGYNGAEPLISCNGNEQDGKARQLALDEYIPGLGTQSLDQFMRRYSGRGDSLLLRGLYEVAGWESDLYRRY